MHYASAIKAEKHTTQTHWMSCHYRPCPPSIFPNQVELHQSLEGGSHVVISSDDEWRLNIVKSMEDHLREEWQNTTRQLRELQSEPEDRSRRLNYEDFRQLKESCHIATRRLLTAKAFLSFSRDKYGRIDVKELEEYLYRGQHPLLRHLDLSYFALQSLAGYCGILANQLQAQQGRDPFHARCRAACRRPHTCKHTVPTSIHTVYPRSCISNRYTSLRSIAALVGWSSHFAPFSAVAACMLGEVR